MSLSRIIAYLFIIVIIFLFLFSFTQVDLSLTLSKASIWQTIQKDFQNIGYFNRSLSTLLYLKIVSLLSIFYIYFLIQTYRKKLKAKDIWIIIGITAGILALSYNAFSYDLFNYIFDAKIITFYHSNPYLHKALDFPNDPMLSFMQWTHRYYPYGPVWLILTVPFSFIGHNIFLVTYFLFKFLIAGFYLGNVYLIYKINQKINPENVLLNTVFFAFNPLVIIECLVSSHNDTAMIFFALLGLYLYFNGKKILAIILIIISSQVKIPTIALLAPMVLSFISFKQFKFESRQFILISIGSMLFVFLYVLTRLEIQPWYFLWIIPLVSLLKLNKYIIALTFGFSIGLLLRYSVYLYFGNWDGIALPLRNTATITALLVPITFVFIHDKLNRKLI